MIKTNITIFGIMLLLIAVLKLHPAEIECQRNKPDNKPFLLNGTIVEAYETGWSNYTQETIYTIRLENGTLIRYQGVCVYTRREKENGSK